MQNTCLQIGGMLICAGVSVKKRLRMPPERSYLFCIAESMRRNRLTHGPGPWHHNDPEEVSVAVAARRPGCRRQGDIAVRGIDRGERPEGACPARDQAAGSGR
ncbi:MAG: hypothetical protein INR63_22680 [Actinomycetospora chiangmaiensis]|nr:hypothetical protein [Actinomycetospora chiangmaiensis]